MKPFEFYVAGVKFHQLKTVLNKIADGNELDLELEPDNKYDANAIKILFEGVMTGYVPKTISSAVTAAIQANGLENISAIAKHVNPSAPTYEQLYVRIALIGEDEESEAEPDLSDF